MNSVQIVCRNFPAKRQIGGQGKKQFADCPPHRKAREAETHQSFRGSVPVIQTRQKYRQESSVELAWQIAESQNRNQTRAQI